MRKGWSTLPLALQKKRFPTIIGAVYHVEYHTNSSRNGTLLPQLLKSTFVSKLVFTLFLFSHSLNLLLLHMLQFLDNQVYSSSLVIVSFSRHYFLWRVVIHIVDCFWRISLGYLFISASNSCGHFSSLWTTCYWNSVWALIWHCSVILAMFALSLAKYMKLSHELAIPCCTLPGHSSSGFFVL